MIVNILCDFDGTISFDDVTDNILERFADDAWKQYEALWLAGKIGSRECMGNQIALIEADLDSLNRYLDSVHIDPSFAAFVDRCKQYHQIHLHVVSDGIDYAITRILKNNNLSGLRLSANKFVPLPGNRYQLTFPNSQAACRVGAGTCKCAIAQNPRATSPGTFITILVGDGLSDVCLATCADFVFAKDRLLEYCRQEAITHTSFVTFSDVESQLEAVLTKWDVSLPTI